jgi:transcriptional regulator with XRE-family HTH domain
MSTFGDTLREARKLAGKTMADLAAHLGVTVPYLSEVETGKSVPMSPARIVEAAEFLNADVDRLMQAALRDRRVVRFEPGDEKSAVSAASALMRGWANFSESSFNEIRILANDETRQAMPDGQRRRTRPADRRRSYVAIERKALAARRVLTDNAGLDVALDCERLFEKLDGYLVETDDGDEIPMTYHVSAAEQGIEAQAAYRKERHVVEISLTPETYEALSAGNGRARYTLCHEIGHAELHPAELRRMAEDPDQAPRPSQDHPIFQDMEWQADVFASALLMPAKGLAMLEEEIERWKVSTDQGIQAAVRRSLALHRGFDMIVASHFRVSLAAARRRLEIFDQRRDELLRVE